MRNPERCIRSHTRQLFPACAVAALLAGCSGHAEVPPPDGRLEPVASVQELMDAELDPAADAIWAAVGSTVTAAGVQDHAPRTAAEWQAVRRNAISLIEATNLLAMTGRRAVAPGGSAPLEGELAGAQIDRLIASHPETFVQFARALRGTARQALAAIDARDPAALMDAGSAIEEACEACHLTFWYPEQASLAR